MNKVMMGTPADADITAGTLDGMFRLRDFVFRQKLGWDVNSVEGRERDHYDELDPVYMVAVDSHEHVEGCWRLLPTGQPYMLRDTFPQLLRGEDAPVADDIWELSRFAVSANDKRDTQQIHLNDVTFEMIRRVYDFAIENNINHYVTVTSVSVERLLKRVGIPLQRFGDGKATKVGKVLSVACWVPVNKQFRDVVYPFYQRQYG